MLTTRHRRVRSKWQSVRFSKAAHIPPAADADLGKEDAAPSGWAVNDAGDLILAFSYSAFGRSFQATAVVPRAAFIDLAAPNYRSVFVEAPVAR